MKAETNTGKILNSWKLLLKCGKWLSEYGGSTLDPQDGELRLRWKSFIVIINIILCILCIIIIKRMIQHGGRIRLLSLHVYIHIYTCGDDQKL